MQVELFDYSFFWTIRNCLKFKLESFVLARHSLPSEKERGKNEEKRMNSHSQPLLQVNAGRLRLGASMGRGTRIQNEQCMLSSPVEGGGGNLLDSLVSVLLWDCLNTASCRVKEDGARFSLKVLFGSLHFPLSTDVFTWNSRNSGHLQNVI